MKLHLLIFSEHSSSRGPGIQTCEPIAILIQTTPHKALWAHVNSQWCPFDRPRMDDNTQEAVDHQDIHTY